MGRDPRVQTGFTPGQADVFGRVLIARQQNGGRALESYSCGSNIVLCGLSMYPSFVDIDYFSSGFLGPVSPQYCASWAPTQGQERSTEAAVPRLIVGNPRLQALHRFRVRQASQM